MSANIFEEVNYNTYIIEQCWNKLEHDNSLLTEGDGPHNYDFDKYPKLNVKDSLNILEYIYQQNSYLLYKEPWYKFLFERLQKDIKKGFVSMIVMQPTLFQKTMRAITPILKLFSKFNLFTQVLDKTNMFYETAIGGCYNSKTNKMLIVVQYIDKSQINLDMLKTILHEYCHFYARKKHDLYVKFFEGMITKFYIALVNAIDSIFKMNLDSVTKKRLTETILKWNFYKLQNLRAKKDNIIRCIEEMEKINETFTNYFTNMLWSKIYYKKDSDLYTNSTECIRQAYLAISDEVTSSHIANHTYCYQEYYCADEVVAIMSFYKPNYKSYLQMLESLV